MEPTCTLRQPDAPVSRRGFIKGAAAGIGVLTFGDLLAQTLLSGSFAAATREIRGNGVSPGLIKLDNNENPLGASPLAVKAIKDHLFEINRYYFYNRAGELTRKIAASHGIGPGGSAGGFSESGGPFGMSSPVIASPGSETLLNAIAMRAAGNGDGEVIEAEPGYGWVSGVFERLKRRWPQINIVRVGLREGYTHDLAAMHRAITPKTTLIVITNPNNPTGTIVARQELEDFVDSVPPQVTVFIDEAYIHFVTEPGYRDAVDLALSRKNVVVTRTFSKVYGLAGMRIGYALAHPEVVDELRMYSGGGLAGLSSVAGVAAMDDRDFVRQTIDVVNEGKQYLYAELEKLGLSYTPSHANFVMVDLKRNKAQIGRELASRKVEISTRPRERYMSNFVRVSIGLREEMEGFVAALREALAVTG